MTEPQYDSAELDALREMERSPGYQLVLARIHEEIARRRDNLEADLNERQTACERGQILGLRTALSIPEILKQEIESALDTHGR